MNGAAQAAGRASVQTVITEHGGVRGAFVARIPRRARRRRLTVVVVRVPGHVACILPLGHDRGDLVVRGAALDLCARDHRLDREADREHVEPRVPRGAEQIEADHAIRVDMLVHGSRLHEDDRRRPRRVVDVEAHAQPVGLPLEDGAVAAHQLDDPGWGQGCGVPSGAPASRRHAPSSFVGRAARACGTRAAARPGGSSCAVCASSRRPPRSRTSSPWSPL
eukprot:scaffold8531_cov62-Phaeocystis_antarctica.AAC.11